MICKSQRGIVKKEWFEEVGKWEGESDSPIIHLLFQQQVGRRGPSPTLTRCRRREKGLKNRLKNGSWFFPYEIWKQICSNLDIDIFQVWKQKTGFGISIFHAAVGSLCEGQLRLPRPLIKYYMRTSASSHKGDKSKCGKLCICVSVILKHSRRTCAMCMCNLTT